MRHRHQLCSWFSWASTNQNLQGQNSEHGETVATEAEELSEEVE
jgi:hypothetical protein